MLPLLYKKGIVQMQDSPKAFVQWLFTQVMERVNVPLSMRSSVSLSEGRLHLGAHSYDLRLFRQVLLVSIGKASVPMAQHVIETIGKLLPLSGIVVGSGTWAAPDGIRYLQGDHPVPYKNSFGAARASLELMRTADEETLVIYLISGGASAMVEAPLDPSISLDDLSVFYERILHSGLSISEANILRKHFSAVKGGRLALAAGPATRCTLLISDVPVGRLNAVGSGPSLADSSTVEECRRLLMETPALAKLPKSIQEFAIRMPETPKHLPEGRAPSVSLSLLSSDSLIEAAKPLVAAAGYRVVVDNSCDDWNYRDAARYLVDRAISEAMKGNPVCILSAGEVTVSIEGTPGIGGRNQQWALEVARLIDGEQGYVAMSVGSDGIDGNSMAAGAVVDSTTWRRAHDAGFHPQLSLAAFDAYPLFAALGDSITPGPSGNNIRDLRIILTNGKSQDNEKSGTEKCVLLFEEGNFMSLVLSEPIEPRHVEILTPQAIAFLAELEHRFGSRRKQLLEARKGRLERLNAGERPDFLPETREIREAEWTVTPVPKDLLDRRVEITGPVDRKMIINALNSGAKVFMADFEDSTTPTWENLIEGQLNLRDAVRRTIEFTDPKSGKGYRLVEKPAVLFVRPRGWHLEERHVTKNGEAISGSLFDFGLYVFHNAKELLNRSSGAYFYLPKLESHLEARLWNDIFNFTEEAFGLPKGAIRGTVLIETILATFEMNEILWELREHSAGLNCGRWDYIFSYIKKFAADKRMLLPDRSQVTMTTHFMRSYSKLAIKTCHRRGTSAMGGMSALIPIKNDSDANEKAIAQVRDDKEREASDGHDGTWVAHPGLVTVAMEVFDRIMPTPNQIDKQLDDFNPTAEDLLVPPAGKITLAGVHQNVAVGLGYLEAWLRGIGCVPLFNLMEDAATAEISRAQLWQWVHHDAHIDTGEPVTVDLIDSLLNDELKKAEGTDKFDAYRRAADIMRSLVREPKFVEFLTLPAYDDVIAHGG